MSSGYLKNSLSPSKAEKVIDYFDPGGAVSSTSSAVLETYQNAFPTVDQKLTDIYDNGLQGMDTPDGFFEEKPDLCEAPPPEAAPAGWTFITAPEDISWDVANQVNRIDIFGTNNPPVVSGARGMRDLTLGNSLVEGFVRGKDVGAKVAALEDLMNYKDIVSDGFVSVPVYQVWANERKYGGPEAYYIIKDIKIKETMRDLSGNTTRAFVDISLMQVPKYQVNSGRDQASAVTAGATSGLLSAAQVRATQQASATQATNAQVDKNIPGNQSGPKAPGAKPTGNQGGRGSNDSPSAFDRLYQPKF